MLGTDDIDVFLRAAFLSGYYEANIKKHLIDHPEKEEKIKQYLNKIPVYNTMADREESCSPRCQNL
jgi:hypothetical protein